MEKYSKEWFIAKFEAIPSEEIGQEFLHQKCALHHCGVIRLETLTEEAKALALLFDPNVVNEDPSEWWWSVTNVNDGVTSKEPTPKERILNKLRSL